MPWYATINHLLNYEWCDAPGTTSSLSHVFFGAAHCINHTTVVSIVSIIVGPFVCSYDLIS